MATPRRHSSTRRGAPAARPAGEIIIRCGGRPVDLRPDDLGPVVSVAALLRREGRGPHAAPGPLRRRAHLRTVDVVAVPPRRQLRKVTVAASALFAIGAIVGPSVLTEAALPHAEAQRPPPGSGRDATPGFRMAPGTSIAAMFLPASMAAVQLDAPTGSAASTADDRQRAGRPLATGPAVVNAGVLVSRPADSGMTTGPGPGAPGPTDRGPTDRGPTNSGPTNSGPTNPGPTNPGPTNPGPTNPGPSHPGPTRSGPGGPAGPDPVLTVPSIEVPVLPGAPVTTPGIEVRPAGITPPSVSLGVSRDGTTVATAPARIATPDVATTEASLGPVTAGGSEVTLPDVDVSGGSVALTPSGPKVVAPDAGVSATKVRAPDVAVGDTTVPLPDVEVPEVAIEDVESAPVGAVAGAVDDTIGGLLGGGEEQAPTRAGGRS